MCAYSDFSWWLGVSNLIDARFEGGFYRG
jgi:hypothetical protein